MELFKNDCLTSLSQIVLNIWLCNLVFFLIHVGTRNFRCYFIAKGIALRCALDHPAMAQPLRSVGTKGVGMHI